VFAFIFQGIELTFTQTNVKKLSGFAFSNCIDVSIINGHQAMCTDQVIAIFLKQRE
jgi:hypothetical protein